MLLMVAAPTQAAAQGSLPSGGVAPAAPSGPTVEGLDAEGRITALNPATRTIRLDDDREYVVPDALPVNWGALRVGSLVRFHYSIESSVNLVSSFRVLLR